MASKINRKYSCDIKGIISTDDGIITVEVEDVEKPIVLADFIKDFVGKPDVKIAVSYGENCNEVDEWLIIRDLKAKILIHML